ncbi:MUS308 and mammalian DNA polymerase-like protein [Actinidia rufa]|uniref:MUS308 and mammalian DNA polymerase-like protein n=1 Tax=Actinidia rufa TaxID=165716 RepID=A0A7J0EHZ1_9ERIC|nr:MUS308 and mammalian DNA polymerase-like protein [Actinidia rufa]
MSVMEDKSSKKGIAIIDGRESHPEGEATCVDEKHPEHAEPGVIPERGEALIKDSIGMSVGTHPIELQASLRKCNRASKASLYMAGCETPGMTTRAHETPKSTCGSSIFSPGEAFWNEAIQVADGFFVTNDNLSIQVDGEISLEKIQCEYKEFKQFENCRVWEYAKQILDEGTSRVGGMEMNAFIGSPRKHGKSLDKGASPLPVKHFDFSSEDRNMDEDNIYPCSEDNKKGIMQKECAQQEQLPASCDVTERTLGVLIQDNDNITSTTHQIRKGIS